MTREITEIKKTMTDEFAADPTVMAKYGLNQNKTLDFSKAHIENIFFYCAAFGIWTLERLFDLFRIETDKKLAELKPHSAKWYVEKIKMFQLGRDFNDDTGSYAVIDKSKQIIKHCAVAEKNGLLNIKVAKEVRGCLEPLTKGNNSEFDRCKNYIDRIRDAGIIYNLESEHADILKVNLLIHYDPLVLNSNGGRTDGSSDTPAPDAINNYLKNLPFNGEYSNMALVDAVRAVVGVKIVHLEKAYLAKSGTNQIFAEINSVCVPYAGYMVLSENSNIKYLPYEY
jgi:hypothetical protein